MSVRSFLITAAAAVSLFAKAEYQDEYLVSVGSGNGSISENQSSVVNFTGSDTIRQSFKIQPDDPRADSAKLHYLILKSYFWAGTGAVINLRIREGSVTAPGAVLYSQPWDRKIDADHHTFSGEPGFTCPSGVIYHQLADFKVVDTTGTIGVIDPEDTIADLKSGLKLKVGREYCFELSAEKIPERSYGFYGPSKPYESGELLKVGTAPVSGADIWFKMIGAVISKLDTMKVHGASGNRFLLDTCSSFFPDKMIGKGKTETVKIIHGADLVPVAKNGSLFTLNRTVSGDTLILAVTGVSEGKTNLFFTRGADTVSMMRITVTERKYLDVSFTYVNFPGETVHPMRSADSAKVLTDSISRLYDVINVELNWKLNPNTEYAWDLDKNGKSWSAEGFERWSPIDSGAIKDQKSVYANLFLIRNETAFAGFDGNGGGSSRGFGAADRPRAAYKAVNVSFDSKGVPTGHKTASCASTLAHELAHTLGVGHYTRYSTLHYPAPYDELNIMKTGRRDERFFGFQWDQVHAVIAEAVSLGESYAPRFSAKIDTVHRVSEKRFSRIDTVVRSSDTIFYAIDSSAVCDSLIIKTDSLRNTAVYKTKTDTIPVYSFKMDTISRDTVKIQTAVLAKFRGTKAVGTVVPNPVKLGEYAEIMIPENARTCEIVIGDPAGNLLFSQKIHGSVPKSVLWNLCTLSGNPVLCGSVMVQVTAVLNDLTTVRSRSVLGIQSRNLQ